MKFQILKTFLGLFLLYFSYTTFAQCPGTTAIDFSGDRCVGSTITFTNSSSTVVGANLYSWNFEGGAIPDNTNVNPIDVTHTFNTPGNYSVRMTRRCNTNTETRTINLQIAAVPQKPIFNSSGNNDCGGTKEINYTLLNQSGGIKYTWDFGDPNSGQKNSKVGTNVKHAFSATGGSANYQVKVTAESSEGCKSESDIRVENIKSTPRVTILDADPNFETGGNFTRCLVDGNSVDSIFVFSFDNQSASDDPNTIYTFNWGDGSLPTVVPSGTQITHKYESFGVSNLIVTGENTLTGCIEVDTIPIINEKFPSASLSIPPAQVNICDSTSVSIKNNSQNATSYIWYFGDLDTTETFDINSVDFKFALPTEAACNVTTALGYQMNVKLEAYNSCFSHENSSPINVRPIPKASFTANTGMFLCFNPGTSEYNVNFTLESCPLRTIPGFATTYKFEIQDPNNPINLTIFPNQSNVVAHKFTASGAYPIKMTATNSCGSDFYFDTLYISDPAIAKFSNDENSAISSSCSEIILPDMSPVSSCGPFNLGLINLSENLLNTDVVSWSVTPNGATFGSSDNSTSQSYNDNIAFDLGKTYTLTLSVSNICNTTGPSTACAIVRVKDIPKLTGTTLSGFEDSDFQLINDPNDPLATGDTLEYGQCDVSTLNSLFIQNLDDSTKTYQWNVNTISGNTTGYANPNDSLPGAITFDPGQYVLDVNLGNECGDTVSAPVKITILEPEAVDAGGVVPAVSVCKDTSFAGRAGVMKEIVKCSGETFNLGENLAKNGITFTWSTDGSFNLDSTITPNTSVSLVNLDTLGESKCQVAYVESDNGICTKLDSVLLVVRSAPLVNIGGSDSIICRNTNAFVLNYSPLGGTWATDSVGVVSPLGAINPSSAPLGLHVLRYTYLDPAPQGCQVTLEKNITFVESTPVNILLDLSYCASDLAFQATANVMGGIWTSDVVSSITTDGLLTTGEIGKGNTASIFYVFTDNNSCISKDTAIIGVNDPEIPNTGLPDSICANVPSIQLTAITPAGIWIDTSSVFSLSSTGIFSPIGLDSGNYQVYYEINSGTPCVQRSLKEIFVKPLDSVTIQEPIGPFCFDDAPSAISASPAGGTWTSPNSSVSVSGADTLFSPSLAGENLIGHLLSYSFTNGFSCTTTKTTSVIVQPLPIVNAGIDFTICQNSESFQLTGFSPTSGGNMEWSVANTSFNTITNTALYQPDSVTKDTLVFKFSLPSLCFVQDTVVINVIAPVVADAGIIDSICLGDGLYTLVSGIGTPFDPTSGSLWQGIGIVSGTDIIDLTAFDVSELNTYQPYIYRYGSGNCETFDTTQIKVFAMPEIVLPTVPGNSICQDATVVTISGYSASTLGVSSFDSLNGVWTGPGIIKVGNNFSFDPSLAGASTVPVSINYTYVDSATKNCLVSNDYAISVAAVPIPDLVIPDLYCVNQLLTIENNSSISFGVLDSSFWKFTPTDLVNEAFASETDYTYLLSGNYTIEYRVVSDKGCDSSLSHQIRIIDPPVADFSINTAPSSDCGPVTATIQENGLGYDSLYFWNFGLDDNLVSTFLPNDTTLSYTEGFITDTFYVVTMIVENQCARDTMTDSVRVLPLPHASLGTNRDVGCSPATFEFNNNSTGYIDGLPTFYNFTFSDGSPDLGPLTNRIINDKRMELAPPPRIFTYEGYNDTTYVIRMTAENACGRDTVFKTIKVLPNDVKAFFNQNLNEGCSPLTINYSDFSSNATFVSYDFGDGTSEVARNVIHTFENNTNQILQFEVSQMVNNQCSYDTTAQTIRVFPVPKASFNIPAVSTCAGDSILFVNTTTGINSSTWIFVQDQDTIKNINTNVFHKFDSSGVQEVKLIVTESLHNCTDTLSKNVTINIVPETTISTDSIEACQPYKYEEIVAVADPEDRFTWIDYLGDTVSVFNAVEYNFPTEGEFSMVLITNSNKGCTDIDTIVFDIHPTPTADFTITSTTDLCDFPKSFTFISNSSSDAQVFEWYENNIRFDSTNTSNIAYASPDSVGISLIAKNNYNCFHTITKPLVIYPLPIANFSAVETVGCEPFLTEFINESQFANSYVWNFGDSTMDSRIQSNHLYTDGTYSVELIATNPDACSDTILKTDYIYVLNKPEADFEYVAEEDTKLYGTIYFTSTSLYSSFYIWEFEDIIEGTDSVDITHRFEFFGEQPVTLITRNENNCSDTITKIIRVPFFGGLYVPNAFIPASTDPGLCTFKPVGFGLKEYKAQVLDTWGNVLWESTALDEKGAPTEGWDGTSKGTQLPENSYVWKVEAIFVDGIAWEGMSYEDGARKRKVGTVTLIR